MPDTEHMPDVVYHYTPMDTLLKILTSRCLRATSVTYLNDSSEHRLFIERIDGVLHELTGLIDLQEFAMQGSSRAPTILDLPFVTCFTTKKDSLTHWRSYCPNGNGVCIGFDTSALAITTLRCPTSYKIVPWHIRFGGVRYIDTKDTSVAEAILMQMYRSAELQAALETRLYGSPVPTERTLYQRINADATFYKHASFFDESEYRLVISGVQPDPDLLFFRASKTSLVPYVEVSIPSDNKDRWHAIRSVTIGPTPNEALSLQAVDLFCSMNKAKANVTSSEIPYRDW